MVEKLKRVKVNTSNGFRYISFRPVPEVSDPTVLICDEFCPYGKICDKLCDPRCPDNKDSCFSQFCGELGDDTDDSELSKLTEMVPVEGTLEDAFGDFPGIYDKLIEANPSVKIKTVIDKVCSGWCQFYEKDHCNCKESNKLCILRDLFLETNKKNKDE